VSWSRPNCEFGRDRCGTGSRLRACHEEVLRKKLAPRENHAAGDSAMSSGKRSGRPFHGNFIAAFRPYRGRNAGRIARCPEAVRRDVMASTSPLFGGHGFLRSGACGLQPIRSPVRKRNGLAGAITAHWHCESSAGRSRARQKITQRLWPEKTLGMCNITHYGSPEP